MMHDRINRVKESIQERQDIENRIINVYLQLSERINTLERRIKKLENGNTNPDRQRED